jgi:hypothetical protein
MKTTSNQLRWWLFVFLTFAMMAIGWMFNLHKKLLEQDVTYIGLSICAMYVLATGWIFFKIRRGADDVGEVLLYLAERSQKLGMLGTMIGMIVAFSGLVQFDISDPEKSKGVVIAMFLGIMTALYTSVVGLIAAMFLEDQAFIMREKHGSKS